MSSSPAPLKAADLLILNHGQVTRMIPELALSSPNFQITSTGGRLSLDIFNVHQPPLHGVSSAGASVRVLFPGWARSTQPLLPTAVGGWMSTKLAWRLKPWRSLASDGQPDREICSCTTVPNAHVYWDGHNRPWPSWAVAPLSLSIKECNKTT
ncbi:hypothetical protein TNCV_1425201 [Trichonephila clavipes]|nr:hypothetical protein TNCV_1425201 [Trichonephila clavipes]